MAQIKPPKNRQHFYASHPQWRNHKQKRHKYLYWEFYEAFSGCNSGELETDSINMDNAKIQLYDLNTMSMKIETWRPSRQKY